VKNRILSRLPQKGARMASYEETLRALNPFRVELQTMAFHEIQQQPRRPDTTVAEVQPLSAFSASGVPHAFATPLTNVHATGVGVRVREGKVLPKEFVIKVYVFQKLDLRTKTPDIMKKFGGIDVDVEPLPVQLAAARKSRRARPARARPAEAAPAVEIPNRDQLRPIPGGVSISPLNARFVGTLGCFVKGISAGAEQIFALSNNHVLADVNSLPVGTVIVQPGPETVPTDPEDAFAVLSNFLPVRFPTTRFERVINLFDAAIARVTDVGLISQSKILGIDNYSPNLDAPVPGTRVKKSGRTTGVTTGVITGVNVNPIQVNYGTQANPRIAIFDDTIQLQGEGGEPFSLPGDSGSVIVSESTGRPLALLFAGDGRSTTACDLGGVCRQFQVVPA
jgi:hypothetical protein